VAAEFGVPGFLLFFSLLLAVVMGVLRQMKRNPAEAQACAMSLIVVCGIALVAFPFRQTGTRLGFWVLAGLGGHLVPMATIQAHGLARRLVGVVICVGMLVLVGLHGRSSWNASRDFRDASVARSLATHLKDTGGALAREELREIDAALTRRPHDYVLELRRAELLRLAGRLDEAETSYLRALARHPYLINARVGLAELYIAWRRITEAREQCDEALRLNPDEPRVQLVLGQCLEAQGYAVRAASAYSRSLDLKPDPPDRLQAHIQLAMLLNEADKIEAAGYHIQAAQVIAPGTAVVLEAQARFIERQSTGSLQAFQAWQRLVSLVPEHAEARLRMGMALLAQGDPAKALESLDASYGLDPRQSIVLLHRGHALAQLGRLQNARNSLLECIQQCVRLRGDETLWTRCRDLLVSVEERMKEIGAEKPG